MEEVKLTKEQEILFEVYDKGVQNEDCNLDAYIEKMKQALSIALVSQRSELLKVLGKHIAEQYDLKPDGVIEQLEWKCKNL